MSFESQVGIELLAVVDDFHSTAAKHERRPHQHRVADALGALDHLVSRCRGRPFGHTHAYFPHQCAAFLAVLGIGHAGDRRAENACLQPAAGDMLGDRVRQVDGGLPAQLQDDAFRFFDVQDVADRLRVERLEV